jgi:hypothetical protein
MPEQQSLSSVRPGGPAVERSIGPFESPSGRGGGADVFGRSDRDLRAQRMQHTDEPFAAEVDAIEPLVVALQ